MTGLVRRTAPLAAVALLLVGLLSGCGSTSSSSSAPMATPAPPASAATAKASACADVKQIQQSINDLKAALTGKDLPAGKTAWSSLTDAVTSLGDTAQATGSAAAQNLHDALSAVTENFAQLDTLGKLTAIVSALTVAGPAVASAVSSTQKDLSCPS
jgi:hypothetical protein